MSPQRSREHIARRVDTRRHGSVRSILDENATIVLALKASASWLAELMIGSFTSSMKGGWYPLNGTLPFPVPLAGSLMMPKWSGYHEISGSGSMLQILELTQATSSVVVRRRWDDHLQVVVISRVISGEQTLPTISISQHSHPS